jgi:hypothetical protein
MEEFRVILVFVAGMLSASAMIAFGIAAHWLSEAYRGQRELRRMRQAIRRSMETGRTVDCDGMRYYPPGPDGRPIVEKVA